MKKLQVQGVHHITIVGSTKQSAIAFWQGVLWKCPSSSSSPTSANPTRTTLNFDPGDGRLLTVFTNETREDAQRPAPRDIGCVEHIAFNVSRATFTQAPARLQEHGIEFIERDRGFMNSIYLKDPNGLKVELACYKFETPEGFRAADVLIQAARAPSRARRSPHCRRAPGGRHRAVARDPASTDGRGEGRLAGLTRERPRRVQCRTSAVSSSSPLPPELPSTLPLRNVRRRRLRFHPSPSHASVWRHRRVARFASRYPGLRSLPAVTVHPDRTRTGPQSARVVTVDGPAPCPGLAAAMIVEPHYSVRPFGSDPTVWIAIAGKPDAPRNPPWCRRGEAERCAA